MQSKTAAAQLPQPQAAKSALPPGAASSQRAAAPPAPSLTPSGKPAQPRCDAAAVLENLAPPAAPAASLLAPDSDAAPPAQLGTTTGQTAGLPLGAPGAAPGLHLMAIGCLVALAVCAIAAALHRLEWLPGSASTPHEQLDSSGALLLVALMALRLGILASSHQVPPSSMAIGVRAQGVYLGPVRNASGHEPSIDKRAAASGNHVNFVPLCAAAGAGEEHLYEYEGPDADALTTPGGLLHGPAFDAALAITHMQPNARRHTIATSQPKVQLAGASPLCTSSIEMPAFNPILYAGSHRTLLRMAADTVEVAEERLSVSTRP